MPTSSRKAPKRERHPQPASLETIRAAANEFVIGCYSIGFLAGMPRSLVVDGRTLWIVPIVLTSPGVGAVGEAGLVAIDAATGRVVGSTPRREVEATARRLRESHRDELHAAFLQARTT